LIFFLEEADRLLYRKSVSSDAATEKKAKVETAVADLMAAMQAEVAGLRVQLASMQDTIVNLTH